MPQNKNEEETRDANFNDVFYLTFFVENIMILTCDQHKVFMYFTFFLILNPKSAAVCTCNNKSVWSR